MEIFPCRTSVPLLGWPGEPSNSSSLSDCEARGVASLSGSVQNGGPQEMAIRCQWFIPVAGWQVRVSFPSSNCVQLGHSIVMAVPPNFHAFFHGKSRKWMMTAGIPRKPAQNSPLHRHLLLGPRWSLVAEVASGWISSVRSWLSLPADGSLATGWWGACYSRKPVTWALSAEQCSKALLVDDCRGLYYPICWRL